MGVVTGGPEMDDAHRLATRLLNVGNGLFILLFLSAYTANLAAFLIRKDTGAFWTDIDAATAAGAKICVHTMLEPKVRLLYPDTNFHPRYMDVAADLQEGLEVRAHPSFAPGRQPYAVEAAPLRWRLQPYGRGCNPAAEAATLRRRLQPCVAEAATLCDVGCSLFLVAPPGGRLRRLRHGDSRDAHRRHSRQGEPRPRQLLMCTVPSSVTHGHILSCVRL